MDTTKYWRFSRKQNYKDARDTMEKFTAWRVNSKLSFTRKSDIARAKPNVFIFCEPLQCANKLNPFKVNINTFTRTFACESGFLAKIF